MAYSIAEDLIQTIALADRAKMLEEMAVEVQQKEIDAH
jgi:hypothetical protein